MACLNSCSKNDDDPFIDDDEIIDESINVFDKIKDPIFKYDIQQKIKQGVIKIATPGILTPSEAATLKEFSIIYSVDGVRLASLEGIEYFTGIEKLSINKSAVELVDLSKNKRLEEINISSCTPESIRIISPTAKRLYGAYVECSTITVEAPQLTHFDCFSSYLNNLDTSGCPKLQSLRCGGSKIKSLDLSNHPELTELSCGASGNISSRTLDISKNRKLKILWAGMGNQPLLKLYVWWNGGRDNVPSQFETFYIEDKTEVLKKN